MARTWKAALKSDQSLVFGVLVGAVLAVALKLTFLGALALVVVLFIFKTLVSKFN